MQSMNLLGGLGACMPPRKVLENVCSDIEFGAFCGTKLLYAKDRLWKSTVREISLAVHATFVFLKLSV